MQRSRRCSTGRWNLRELNRVAGASPATALGGDSDDPCVGHQEPAQSQVHRRADGAVDRAFGALLLGVERIRQESAGDVRRIRSPEPISIVGARSSPVHLLLSSVFRIGNASNNVSWDSYLRIAALPEVAWTIPLSLGDSHRGFRVLGTTQDYFDHFRFAQNRKLELVEGGPFADADGTVLGAEVAAALGYRLGQQIVIAHGSGDVAFALHKDHPFRVVGILARTGTPVDRAIHVSLEGMDAVHAAESAEAGADPLAAAMRNAKQREAQSAGRNDQDLRPTIMASTALAKMGARCARSPPSSLALNRAIRRCSCNGR